MPDEIKLTLCQIKLNMRKRESPEGSQNDPNLVVFSFGCKSMTAIFVIFSNATIQEGQQHTQDLELWIHENKEMNNTSD